MPPNIAIVSDAKSCQDKAQSLAHKLKLPLVETDDKRYQFHLAVMPEHLELRKIAIKTKPIYVDFLSGKLSYRAKHGGGRKQLLARAVNVKGKPLPTVLDATSGFGTDAFVLASLGCEVLMLERSPIIGALLQDGLDRLRESRKFNELKLDLIITDACDYLEQIIQTKQLAFDVIYLDPMYPERSNSALGKNTLRVLRELVGDDMDADALLPLAIQAAKKRVVVKRPKHAPFLCKQKPDIIYTSGNSSRFDVYE
ncbi:MAG: class I SAM-dependent methyltransferase [Gammaproteobacteria bacterium]|nr:class I SAM-dependent methyltransferase [Gammaproteobacteria bacterium]